jgi:SanA protein
MRFIFKSILMAVSGAFAFTVLANVWIVWNTSDRIYSELNQVSATGVALVLGTAKGSMAGGPNSFFTTRMQAAAELYHSGKVKHLILSGDNETKYYNEPLDMMNALLVLGVPKEKMTLDYAGFRTLDSVVRCKEVFGQTEIIVVTQEFHANRALFICDFYGIKAITFAANDAEESGMASAVSREWLARPKAVLDLYLLKQPPKFLGEKEFIAL